MNGNKKAKYEVAEEAMRLIVSFTEIKKACWDRPNMGCTGCSFNVKMGDRYLCDMFTTQNVLEMAYDAFTEYLDAIENDRQR